MAKASESAQFTLLKKALATSKSDGYESVWHEMFFRYGTQGILPSVRLDIENAGYGKVAKSRSETTSFLIFMDQEWKFLGPALDGTVPKALKELKDIGTENYNSDDSIEKEARRLVDKFWKSEGGAAQLDRLIKHFEKFYKTLDSQNKSKKRFLKMKKLLRNPKFLKGHYSKFANDDAIKDFKEATDRLKEIRAKKLLQAFLVDWCVEKLKNPKGSDDK